MENKGKKIIILGAGGDGRTIAEAISDNIIYKKNKISLIGYLDDDPNKQNTIMNDIPTFGPLTTSNTYPDCFFISSFGSDHNYKDKKGVIEKLNLPKEKYVTILHSNSHLSRNSKIGVGCYVGENTIIGTNTTIGDHVKILENTIISHDTVISDYCCIANSVSMGGRVFLEESCYIGMNASIKSDIRIGKGSIVGMGSVIIRDVPPNSTVVGNPGRILEKSESNPKPTVYLSTNGCVGGQLSTKCLRTAMELNKIPITSNLSEADYVIFYGCGLTDENEKKTLKIINQLKNNLKPSTKLIVWGCLPKQNLEALSKIYYGPTIGPLDLNIFNELFNLDKNSFKDINYSAEPKELRDCREALAEYKEEKVDLLTNNILLFKEGYSKIGNKRKKNTPLYNILVATGCTGNCSYCSEKPVFGGIKSRPVEDVIADFDMGLELGYNRFSFLATDLGAYGFDINTNIGELAQKIEASHPNINYKIILNQIEPHNLTQIYPSLEKALASGKVEELMCPVQSGSNRILKLMNRKYSVEEWKKYMIMIKNGFPSLRLNTHFMVGFPTETEEDFKETMGLLDSIRFDDITVFKYSSRPTVRSTKLEGQVPEELKKQRRKRLMKKFALKYIH